MDNELFSRLIVTILDLRDENKQLAKELEKTQVEVAKMHDSFQSYLKGIAVRERKLQQIQHEVDTYQFDSATNLQNKLKTILMSESGIEEHQD